MEKICFVINGTLKGKKRLEQKLADVFGPDYLLEFHRTKARNHATDLTVNCIKGCCNYLIAVGGDGTMNEVINGYMQSEEEQRQNVVLGLLPSGTGNDFARTIGVRKSITQLQDLLRKQSIHPIDVGSISYIGFDKKTKFRYFNNIADIGIGGQVVAMVNKSNKMLGANLTFIWAVIRSFFSYKNKHVSLVSPALNWEGNVVALCMANGKYFGSGLGVAPDAIVDDGIFELVIIGDVTVLDYLKYLPTLKKTKRIKHPEIHYHRLSNCQFDSIDNDCPIDMDGEFIGFPPIDLRMNKHAAKFLRP